MIQNNSKPSQSKKRILLYLLLPITFLFASSGITSLFLTSCNKTGTETTFKNFKTKDGKTDVAYGDTAILTAEIKNGVGVVNLVSDDDSVSDEIEIKNVEAEIIDGKVEFEITNNAMSDNIKCNFHLENNGVESKKLTISFKKFVPDPADIIEIDSAIENNYLIPADADITISKTNEKIKFGHPLLDLKALSSDNGNKTYFRLTGDVTFGFLVDPEMTCYLDAENNAKSTITVQDKNACSVVVGTTGSNSFNDFDNKLIIDKSLTLKITSNILTLNGDAVSAWGVYIGSMLDSANIDICGKFEIDASLHTVKGVEIKDIAHGSKAQSLQKINAEFVLKGNIVRGIEFSGSIANGKQTIDGNFNIESKSYATGVLFNTIISGNQTINATFKIVDKDSNATGVQFGVINGGKQTVNGVYSIKAEKSFGNAVIFDNNINSGSITINGIFSIISMSTSAITSAITINGSVTGTTIDIKGLYNVYAYWSMYGIYINNDGKTFNGNTVNIYGTFNLKYGGSVESKDVFFIQICFQKTIATFAQETTLFIDGLFALSPNIACNSFSSAV